MKRQIVGPVLGKLVHQLPRVFTLAYDLRLMRTIASYKYLSEHYNFGKSNINIDFSLTFKKKNCLGPQNGSRSSGPKKLLKIVNCSIIKKTVKLKEIVVGLQMG